MFERELTVMDGAQDGERISVVEISYPASISGVSEHAPSNHIELRFEQQVGDAGWVVQRRIPIAAHDVCQLRQALTLFSSSNPSPCCASKVVCFADYRDERGVERA